MGSHDPFGALPRAKLRASRASGATQMVTKPARLLIADAHQNMLEAVQSLLEGLFETVAIVGNGDSLLEISADLKPDLIVVDLSLPVSGAANVLRHPGLKALFSPAKVIVLSIHDEAVAVREAFAEGAMGFVLKRAAATDLIPAVNAVLRDRKYVSPGVQGEGRAAT